MEPAVVWSPEYACDIGEHVFPTLKYGLVHAALLAAGDIAPGATLFPAPPERALLALAHTAEYLEDLEALRVTHRTARSELPLTAEIVRAFSLGAAGTALAAREALRRGAAVHVGGGLHHAYAGHAEGFCYLNDLAVAARAVRREGLANRVAVVDLDVHQGNGTAGIFADEPEVFTLSVHQENNYPVPKERGDLDVGLPDGTGDEEYLAALAPALERTWAHRPDLVLYQAGADPYADDQLGGLALTLAGLQARDRLVVEGCAARGIPVALTLGGGYARRVEDTVGIHLASCRTVLSAGTRKGRGEPDGATGDRSSPHAP